MARQLCIWLSREQVRAVHGAATTHAKSETDITLKQRWETIVKKTQDALDYDARTSGSSTKQGA
jgi:hypothetical protein